MAWTEQTIQKAMAEGARQASVNMDFRKLILSNPNAAIKQISGEELPEGFTLRFVESEGADLTLVLPDFQSNDELDDADLEQVSGGSSASAIGMRMLRGGPSK